MKQDGDLLRLLRDRPWDKVRAKCMPASVFWSVIFEISERDIYIGGIDQVMKDGYDTFSLTISDNTGKEWFPTFSSGPRVLDFKEEWRTKTMALLLEPPRSLRFFTDEGLQKAVYGDETFLGKCGALEISSLIDPNVRLLLQAEQCNITIWVDKKIDRRISPPAYEYDPGPY